MLQNFCFGETILFLKEIYYIFHKIRTMRIYELLRIRIFFVVIRRILIRIFVWLPNEKRYECRDDEQNGNNNTCCKECLFKSTLCVETTAEVVAECATTTGRGLL